MADAIYVFMRWLHISSAVTLIGGIIFGRWVMTRAADGLSPEAREAYLDRAAGIFQPLDWPELEIAYSLDRPYWRQGYATEAAKAARDLTAGVL